MAFFRNYSSETVSQSFLDDQSQRPRDDRIHRSSGNVDAHVMSCDKEFDMNVDVKYQSEDEQDGPSGLQNEAAADEGTGAGVSNSQSSGRRTNVAGKWGSTFWKDCQPMCPQSGSDSGQDTKSGSEYRNAVGSEDNSSDVREDRLDSEDDAGPKVRKGQRGHSDIPADEMLSDEYYEQDGEEQSDSMHYRGFHHSVGSTSRLQAKPAPITNHRTSRLSNNNGNYDDVEDDNENIDGADADYEEEDEDEDDPDDADFEPDYGVASGYAAKKVRRAPAPRNVASNVKDQIIRSRKGWLKRKAAEASTSNAGASTSAQAQGPLTQTSQNPAARGASKN